MTINQAKIINQSRQFLISNQNQIISTFKSDTDSGQGDDETSNKVIILISRVIVAKIGRCQKSILSKMIFFQLFFF